MGSLFSTLNATALEFKSEERTSRKQSVLRFVVENFTEITKVIVN